MAFETSITLKDCLYTYKLHPNVKKFTLKDNTFAETKVGNFELSRLLEEIPNSGQGFLLKIIFNKDLSGFKINITDKSITKRERLPLPLTSPLSTISPCC